METEKAKNVVKAANELSETGKDLHVAVRGTTRDVAATKKLWREGDKSRLIKIGVACIVFPDPSPVSDIIGAGFITAGLVQKGIKKQTLYLEDIKKTFERTLRDVQSTRESMRL